jgi:D-sedoheptulose 7-phosphate isomerase
MHMQELFQKHSKELQKVLDNTEEFHEQIRMVARQMKEAFARGNKVLVAGNGGSAAEAQHLSDEMVGRYKGDRGAYPVVALTADGAVLTCIGNDYGYDEVFKRQVEALGKEGDIFVGLTTSGTSKNILKAAEQARGQGMTIVAMTGLKGSFREMADYAIVSPSETNPRIQEMHLHAIHLLCEMFETEVPVMETASNSEDMNLEM